MKPNEALSLQALLVALSQLDTALPSDLQVDIQQAGDKLSQGDSGAIAAIDDLVRRYPTLHQLHRLARLTLQQQYQDWDSSRKLLAMEVEEESTLLKQIAAQVLRAVDPVSEAQAQLRQIKIQLESNHGSKVPPLLEALYDTAAEMNAEATAVLKAIERRPLTVENLCYTLQLSAEQVKALVQYLWNAGYIATTGGMLPKLLARLRRRNGTTMQYQSATFSSSISGAQSNLPQQVTVDFPAYFTLTAKGHFHLHPLVTAGRREGFS